MLKTPRAPVSGFTPQVRRATPGTAQQVANDMASNGLEESRGHNEQISPPSGFGALSALTGSQHLYIHRWPWDLLPSCGVSLSL